MGVQFYRCPNCGRIYGYGEFDERTTIINCLNCRYPLKKYQDVKHVRHPELSEPKVIGTIDDLNESQITCPTCSSTNVKKISTWERAFSIGTWGLASRKMCKSFECKTCGYTW